MQWNRVDTVANGQSKFGRIIIRSGRINGIGSHLTAGLNLVTITIAL